MGSKAPPPLNPIFSPPSRTGARVSACSQLLGPFDASLWRQPCHIRHQTFEAMQASGIAPDVTSYTALMGACVKANQWQQALGVFEDMLQSPVVPNALTYVTILKACRKGAAWQKVWCGAWG